MTYYWYLDIDQKPATARLLSLYTEGLKVSQRPLPTLVDVMANWPNIKFDTGFGRYQAWRKKYSKKSSFHKAYNFNILFKILLKPLPGNPHRGNRYPDTPKVS